MDENSMSGRLLWSWFEHRSEKGRRCISQSGSITPNLSIAPEQSKRPWGGTFVSLVIRGFHSKKSLNTVDNSDVVR
eukprot:14369244-Ditylum_brightwellii.AAC.1